MFIYIYKYKYVRRFILTGRSGLKDGPMLSPRGPSISFKTHSLSSRLLSALRTNGPDSAFPMAHAGRSSPVFAFRSSWLQLDSFSCAVRFM